MLIAGLGVAAALAFVLGLGALCLYVLKRWGTGALSARTRIAVEVVQRVSLGPRTGLAVVRVGEKVIALSVGDGGVRPLFELDDSDRQQVIATSTIPQPQMSSIEASAMFDSLAPNCIGSRFTSLAGLIARDPKHPTSKADVLRAVSAVQSATSPSPGIVSPNVIHHQPRSPGCSEVPGFLTTPLANHCASASATVNSVTGDSRSRIAESGVSPAMANTVRQMPVREAQSDRDFHAILGVSLSAATRLLVLIAATTAFATPISVARAASLAAFEQPPTPVAPTATPPLSVGAPAGTHTAVPSPAAGAVPLVVQPPVVNMSDLPPLVPADRRNVRAATPRNDITNGTAKAPTANISAAQRAGNGGSTTNRGTSATRPMSEMVMTPAVQPTNQAAAAILAPVAADDAILRMMPQMDVKFGGDGNQDGLRLNGTVGIVVMMGLLTLLPTLLLMMTGFTRILIVLHFLKQAMGTQTAPPGHLLAGMALLLTAFVMGPTLTEVNRTAITPWLDGQMSQVEMMKTGVQPLRTFMLKQTRQSDVETFVRLSRMERPETIDDVPLHVVMSAFVASELRTAFQIGFAIYLPFIIIDAVVASVLMSMGMFMLPPAMISLPFKLLLFVLVDGWSLTITSLVQSFR